MVQDCTHFLIPPSRSRNGQVCPDHGTRVHSTGTFTYQDPTRNFIVHSELVRRVIRHPGKFESHRLGYEKSEDAVTLNVFRSFQEAGCLNEVARLITGLEVTEEPRLFLWGIDLSDDTLPVWPLLQAARQRFEKVLPVERPATEPDIGLFLDGHYLALIEAKLTSPNTFYVNGPRKDGQSLTKDELLTIYHDRAACQILDLEKARAAEAVAYQCWLNTVFAEWMATKASPGTRAYFCNLVRAGYEIDSFEHFHRLVRPEFATRELVSQALDRMTVFGGDRLALLPEAEEMTRPAARTWTRSCATPSWRRRSDTGDG